MGYMALGERTPPPAGFVDFCARKPEQCGLKVQAASDDSPDQAQASIQKTLYRRYLWSVAFHLGGAAVQTAAAPAPAGPEADGARLQEIAWRPGADSAPAPAQPSPPPLPAPPSLKDGVLIEETRAAPELVALNTETTAELNMVNRMVNDLIVFAPDTQTYGVADYWAEPLEDQAGPKRGDCEDYVLEKRRALIARGIPEAALSIAVVRTPRGEDHAVLLVATDQGELVLDSLSPWIVGWRDTPYTWVERQVPGSPMVWVKTGPRPKTSGSMIAAGVQTSTSQPAAG